MSDERDDFYRGPDRPELSKIDNTRLRLLELRRDLLSQFSFEDVLDAQRSDLALAKMLAANMAYTAAASLRFVDAARADEASDNIELMLWDTDDGDLNDDLLPLLGDLYAPKESGQ